MRIADPEVVIHLPTKAERIAMEEVKGGLVYWDMRAPKTGGSQEGEA